MRKNLFAISFYTSVVLAAITTFVLITITVTSMNGVRYSIEEPFDSKILILASCLIVITIISIMITYIIGGIKRNLKK
jgi:inner membrane protein involved in colicin E2 resistance